MPREIGRRRTSPSEYGKGSGEEKARARITKDGESVVSGGWSSEKAPKLRKTGNFTRFSVDENEEVLIKFVEDKPFASFWQHWIEKKPYTCTLEDDCPLCKIGDTSKPVDCFNVLKISDTGTTLMLWQLSSDPATAVKARAEKDRYSPINKPGLYFAVSKAKGSNGFFSYSVDPVREDELKDDWGVEPLTEEQVTELSANAYEREAVVKETPRHELVELANGLAD